MIIVDSSLSTEFKPSEARYEQFVDLDAGICVPGLDPIMTYSVYQRFNDGDLELLLGQKV